MLAPREKREMREDGASISRRRHFRTGKFENMRLERSRKARSLDSYMQFLQDIQKVFGPFKISRRKTIITTARL